MKERIIMAKVLKVIIKNDDLYDYIDSKELQETLISNYPKIDVEVEDENGTADEK